MSIKRPREINHIAIIGCGYTGTSTFFQLVRNCAVRKITIFEKSGEFGPGYAYKTSETPDYLINNRADTMGLEPGNRRAFFEWLNEHPELVDRVEANGHYPRSLFGAFLEDTYSKTLGQAAARRIEVHQVVAEVTGIDEDPAGRVRITYNKEILTVDKVILSTGRCPDLDAYESPMHELTCRYYPTHIPGQILDDIPLDADCHVLGTSLSAYDVVNRLFSPETGCVFIPEKDGSLRFVPNGNHRRIFLCSRSGRLKKMQSKFPEQTRPAHFNAEKITELSKKTSLTLENLSTLVKHETTSAGWRSINWDAILDPYRGCTTASAVNERAATILAHDIASAKSEAGSSEKFLVDIVSDSQLTLWEIFASGALKLEDEMLYRRKFETSFLTYFAACPVGTAEKVLALMKADRLVVVRGVTGMTLNKKDDCYNIQSERGVDKARVVINTTGSVNRRVDSASQTMLTNYMYKKGLSRPYSRAGIVMNGISVDMNSFRLPGCKNIYVANQFLWGPGFFVSSAFIMSVIVSRILKHIYSVD